LRSASQKAKDQENFSRQHLETQGTERARIAGELHDGVGQEILMLKGQVELAAMKYPKIKETLAPLSNHFADTIEEVRSISHNLRPPHIKHFGLSRALEGLFCDLHEATKLTVETEIEELAPHLPGRIEITFIRIAQESIANMIKHSEATCTKVSLRQHDGTTTLTITDNGRGFSTSQIPGKGLGLTSMAERAKLTGATCRCNSAPGRGTKTIVTFQT